MPKLNEKQDVVVNAGIDHYKDFEIEIVDDQNFVLKHKNDENLNIQVSMQEKGDGSLEFVGLPEALKAEMRPFSKDEIRNYPSTVLKVILGQLYQPKQALKDSGEI